LKQYGLINNEREVIDMKEMKLVTRWFTIMDNSIEDNDLTEIMLGEKGYALRQCREMNDLSESEVGDRPFYVAEVYEFESDNDSLITEIVEKYDENGSMI